MTGFDADFMAEHLYYVLSEHGMGHTEDFKYKVGFHPTDKNKLNISVEHTGDDTLHFYTLTMTQH